MSSPAITPEISLAQPLKGKNTLVMIARDPDPGNQLVQRTALLELFLSTLEVEWLKSLGLPTKGVDPAQFGLNDLVKAYGYLFGCPDRVFKAIAVRNSLMHARSQTITITEKRSAAEVMDEALRVVLPHVPQTMRDYAFFDPHQPEPSEPLPVILAGGGETSERLQKLERRLSALLAISDQQSCQPAYDLELGQSRATPLQRLDRNKTRFDPSEYCRIQSAVRLAEEDNMTSAKRSHLASKLAAAAMVLEKAIISLERDLGLEQPEPGAQSAVAELSTQATPELLNCIEQLPKDDPERTELASVQPSIVDAAVATDNKEDSPPPGSCWLKNICLRITVTRSATRLLRWLIASTFLFFLCGAGGCLLISRNTGDQLPGPSTEGFKSEITGRPVLVSWTSAALTAAAKRAGASGKVLLAVWVDRNGAPIKLQARNLVGYGLEEKAIEAVRHWRFAAASWDLRTAFTVTVEFSPIN